ncbi:hypothetical protein [Streptomyces sp. CBMA123]|uniref:hypothetical protein n=1 Tax=Streptomyces sp. CBMA123 TaxID=1896313 RepID=UPI001661C0E3|nr:hypothetical protein [Streptomyces sp. CBMA123]MBD0695521.1 hypothetical protein [Streptomyces sp. CBMA123]
MNLVQELWARSEIADYDALFRADGTAREAFIDGPDTLVVELGEPFDVEAPEFGHEIEVRSEAELPDGRGFVCCGDGAMGDEGFLARLDADRRLVWVFASTGGNPFLRASADWPLAHFVNDWGRTLTIDLADPDYAAP